MYAILKTGGKQYKVSEGDVIYVEKLGVEDGATVSFDEVLVVGEGDSITVGAPYVSGAVVTGTVEKTGKGKKINIFKMKPKKGYRRRQEMCIRDRHRLCQHRPQRNRLDEHDSVRLL